MITYPLLKNCLRKIEDVHPDIIGIKRFLNAHPKVTHTNISLNAEFCAQTRDALTQFQKYNGLPESGTMNIETWEALGTKISGKEFEVLFGASPNARALRGIVYKNKYRKMFPTESHTKLIRYAFSEEGRGGGGLSATEVDAIDRGRKLTDTYFGTGSLFDIPITLLIGEAPKHAMTPEGMTVEDAQKKGYEWIRENCRKAREQQKQSDFTSQNNSQTMSLEALNLFGKACHTYMDSVSPAHRGWQEYKMPRQRLQRIEPKTGMIYEYEVNDIARFISEGLQHKAEESGEPTEEQYGECALYMRSAFLTTFTNKWFVRATKSQGDKDKVYSFLRAANLSWSESFGALNIKDSAPVDSPKIKINE